MGAKARLAGHNSIRHVMSFDAPIPYFIAGTGLCRARPLPPSPGSGPWVSALVTTGSGPEFSSPPFDLPNRRRPKLYGRNPGYLKVRSRAVTGFRMVVCLVLLEAESQSHRGGRLHVSGHVRRLRGVCHATEPLLSDVPFLYPPEFGGSCVPILERWTLKTPNKSPRTAT